MPFYKKRFTDLGLDPGSVNNDEALLQIPPTTKDDIMAHFPEQITAQGMNRKYWKYVATTGTTRRIMGVLDVRKANISWAAVLRDLKLAGGHTVGKKWIEILPHMCTDLCGINDILEKKALFGKEFLERARRLNVPGLIQHFYEYFFSRRDSFYRRIQLPSFGSEGTNIPHEDIVTYLKKIDQYNPNVIEALPLYIHVFAKHILRNGKEKPKVRVIRPSGGSMTEGMKRTIRRAFNCDVYDSYGCSELGMMACDCPKHEGLHLMMDLFHIQFCRDGKNVAPGELGKLYITDLENHAMPWIRYDIGDVGRYYLEDHECGRHSIRFNVEGRLQDTIVNSKGEPFSSDRVYDFFHAFEEIDNFQLIEKNRGKFDLLCVPANGKAIDKMLMAKRFGGYFDERAMVRVYSVKTIKAEDGGKFRFIKSKSYDLL
ncbi:MAG: phenylacetate--CoA ligase family protein [Planctomycetota bacterium]